MKNEAKGDIDQNPIREQPWRSGTNLVLDRSAGSWVFGRKERHALVWDGRNTSSVILARTLRQRGWTVDAILAPNCAWRGEPCFNGVRTFATIDQDDETILQVLLEHPLDGLFLHGDAQLRWLLSRWNRLSPAILAHLPSRESLQVALSKEQSLEFAERLGIPVLETRRCTSPREVKQAGRELAGRGEIVLKGEGSSAGSAVTSIQAGREPAPDMWARLTRLTPQVLVQRRIRGPRVFVTVAYARGVELAACAHEKISTWPHSFGVTALGVTRNIEEVHVYTQRLFERLHWHGIANAEFRQDPSDGKWYFMEINPRINCSLGIQARAGVDVVASWAAQCEGSIKEARLGRTYRSGVCYWWAIPTLALALRRPWAVPWQLLLSGLDASDWRVLDGASRARLIRVALWAALST